MPNCLNCGSSLLDSELAVGKCEKCRKQESDITAQQQHDREQHAKLQDAQQEYEKQQQKQWQDDVEVLIENATKRSSKERSGENRESERNFSK